MAKFKHKLTGDIITAHFYNGDIEALKEAMPLLSDKCIDAISEHCVNRYIFYTMSAQWNKICVAYSSSHVKPFKLQYKLYQEPQDSNQVQAIKWLEQGKLIHSESWWSKRLYKIEDNDLVACNTITKDKVYAVIRLCDFLKADDWQIYEEPLQVKVTKLPHEFIEGEEVLVREYNCEDWFRANFCRFDKDYIVKIDEHGVSFGTKYVIPYAGNEHLKNKVTDCESGKIPQGYSAHKPKLGDADYWQLGDDVVDLALGTETEITLISYARDKMETIGFDNYKLDGRIITFGAKLRTLYHKGSTVNEDGTVNEFVPWRVKYEQ